MLLQMAIYQLAAIKLVEGCWDYVHYFLSIMVCMKEGMGKREYKHILNCVLYYRIPLFVELVGKCKALLCCVHIVPCYTGCCVLK